MASVQCKMCGYMMEWHEGMTVGECPACGSVTTFPKLTSEHTEQLYARAEHFRQANDFDRALEAYEAIVRNSPEEAEAYWGIVLSRYGIEYVEDPVSHQRVPTCHRVQYESILADSDYKAAMEYADASSSDVYEAEAKRIAEIQKGILAISAQEKPFDVFICYKENTDGGSRTKDSTIAQDIYYQLTNAGYKVFFARITLEDKLGQQYEPYIFAALNSSKVMLVIGSKKEYFNAVWVKNEWSRFLALMKKDRSRLLIPCYKDMDAYDIPDELSMLQSQDMSKIGFIQDLLRGIRKVLSAEKPASAAAAPAQADSELAPLIKRIEIFLETGDFAQAREYCNKVLDKDPENARVYLYLLMAENKVKSEDDLRYYIYDDLESMKNFQLAMKFADTTFRTQLQAQIKNQKDERDYEKYRKLFRQYQDTSAIFPEKLIKAYQSLAENLGALGGYRDAAELKSQCEQAAEKIRQETYETFNREYEKCVALTNGSTTSEEWKAKAKMFRGMSGVVAEADEVASQCEENALSIRYDQAIRLKNAKEYDEAIRIFTELGKYSNSEEQIRQIYYEQAIALKNAYKFREAVRLFKELGEYKDSVQQLEQCHKEEDKVSIIVSLAFLILVVLCAILTFWGINRYINMKKRLKADAETAYRQGNYLEMKRLKEKIWKIFSTNDIQDIQKKLTSVSIPEGVTEISDYEFNGCTNLKSVSIPGSVTKIGDYAFNGCTKLKSVNIPNDVTKIGDYAFHGCPELTSVSIPGSVTKIGDFAFKGCPGLTKVNISDGVTEIGEYAFAGCRGLTSVIIPGSVTKIGDYVFSGCTGLKSMKISAGIMEISDDAFRGCPGLTNLSLPVSVTKIFREQFKGCFVLKNVSIFGNGDIIKYESFKNCTSLQSVSIHGNVERICSHAFHGCTSLTSVNIHGSVKEIEGSAFEYCTSLTSVNIHGGSVKEIDVSAFEYCTSLTSVRIPKETTISHFSFPGSCQVIRY